MKVRNKVFVLFLILAYTAANLTGCAPVQTPVATNPPPAQEATLAPAPTQTPLPEPTEVIEPTPASRTVVDMAGRSVTLPNEINSIATFGSIGVLNTIVETLGQGSKIYNEGSDRFTSSKSWEKYQYLFAPQIKGAPVFEDANGEIVMEAVLAAKPDISLAMTKPITEQLEAQGLNVVYIAWAKTEDVYAAITLLGEVFNVPDLAADYLTYFDEKVAESEALIKEIADADKKTVLYGNPSSFTQPHVIAEWWIPAAGGISVTGEIEREKESLEYTAEDLLLWNPDVMIVTSSGEVGKIKDDIRFADVTAVKEDQIYVVPRVAHVWGNRTTEQPLTIFWTMHKLYPEIITEEVLAEEIFYFYSHFFKVDLTDEQIQEIINFK